MLVELKVNEFMQQVASSSPAPGGGSVAALSASAGASLIAMLANLTKDKKGYEEYHSEMEKIAAHCERMSQKLLSVIDIDCKAFNIYMDAIRLPKSSDEEKHLRTVAMQEAAVGATNVPLQLARDTFELIKKAEYVLKYGNANAKSDGAVALLMLRSGILGALYNVRINLGLIKDEKFIEKVRKEVETLEAKTKELETNILSGVTL